MRNRDSDFPGTERFAPMRRLGAGGMGVVYEAYDRERREIVALKTLLHTGAADLYRLKKEFRALADVSHPNLVSLYELIADEERWFFTMELVRGVNFLEYVAASFDPAASLTDPPISRLPTPDLHVSSHDATETRPFEGWHLEIPRPNSLPHLTAQPDLSRLRSALRQLVGGICALHAAGKLHRDVKPSNVLVTPEGRVVLLDFGLVTEFRTSREDESLILAGTPAYMSPEQGSGRESEASDWYSVGVMLYQALTGRLPVTGGSFLEVMTRKQQPPPAPSQLVPEVSEDLDLLCQQLLRPEPEQRPSDAEILSRLRGSRSTWERPVLRTAARTAPFVGRESHLASLRDALLEVKEGRTIAVCVHGSSGLGKTALVRRFLDEIQDGDPDVVVLQGRCYEQESVPYKALDSLVDALSQYLMHLSRRDAEALVPRGCSALERLFPVLRQVDAFARARRQVLEIADSQELRRRAFAALRELLSRLTDRVPVVLFIDDLQWGDVDSAALLGELLRPPDAPALLLIASYRTEEIDTSPLLKTLLASLRRFEGTSVREVVVGELSAEEARSLAQALLKNESGNSARHAATIARESGGSPLFIGELARHAEEAKAAVPAGQVSDEISLDGVIHGRVSRLPDEARRLLEITAVAGQPLSLSVAMRAADLSLKQHEVLGLLRSGHLIRTRETHDQDEIETYHDRIRETVHAHLEPQRLKSHHQSLASALEASGNADPETLAVHWSAAGDRDRAARYASLAATQASEAFAFDRAARLYQLALALQPTTDAGTRDLLIRLADALVNAGRGAEAARAYEAASRQAAAAEALELKRRAAEQLLRSGHIDEGLSALRMVLNSMGMKLADTPTRALASLVVRRAYASLRGRSFRFRSASEISAEELARVDTCWSVAVGLSMVDVVRGADFQARHLLLALKAGEPSRIARALATEAPYIATIGVRARRRAEKVLREAEALAHQINEPAALGRAELAAGITAYLTGRWKQAVEFTFRAEEILRDQCTGVAWERNTAHHFSLMSCMYLGEWREIARRLPRLLAEAADRGDLLAEANLGTRLSYVLLLADDDAERAREQCRAGLVSWSQQGFHTQHYYDLVRQGEIALYAGAPHAAWEIVTKRWRALSHSLILRIQTFRIEALHLRARIALAAATSVDPTSRTDVAELLHAARRSANRLANERTTWARALSQLIYAGLCASRGRQVDAARALISAEADFESSDMALYAAVTRRCRGQLVGGDEGRMMVEAADERIRSQRIKNPERITAMLAPGSWLAS